MFKYEIEIGVEKLLKNIFTLKKKVILVTPPKKKKKKKYITKIKTNTESIKWS